MTFHDSFWYWKLFLNLTFFVVLKMLQFQEKAFEIWFRRFISVDVVLYLEVPQKKMLTKWKKFLWLLLIITTCCAKMPRKFVQLFHVNSGMCLLVIIWDLRSFLFRFFYSVFFSWRISPRIRMVEWLHVSSHVISITSI